MDKAILGSIAILLSIIVYAWHRFFYDYQITKEHVVVTWLGVSIRKIRLRDIETISKRRKHSGENWANTWRPRHRILVLRRRSGWRRDFVITPAYRYEFRNQLEAAMKEGEQPEK